MLNGLKQIVKNLITDSGFGFTMATALLFAATNPLGLGVMIAVASLITLMKVICITQPAFIHEGSHLDRILKDKRTSLRLLGTSELLVMATVLGINGVTLMAQAVLTSAFVLTAMMTVAVPALCATAYAIADLTLAAQISRVMKLNTAEKETPAPVGKLPLRKTFARAAKQPEFYLTIADILAGLMSGGLSILFAPLTLMGANVARKNIIERKPEHNRHPKLYYGGACIADIAIGIISGNYFPAAAAAVDATYLTLTESQLTPGGIKQVGRDVASVFLRKKKFSEEFQQTSGSAKEPASPQEQKPTTRL